MSVAEYYSRKQALRLAGLFHGYAEIMYSPEDGRKGERFGITDVTEIGATARAGIAIYDERVAKKHARLTVERDGRAYLYPFKGLTKLNGLRITDREQVFTGDVLTIGETALILNFKEEEDV